MNLKNILFTFAMPIESNRTAEKLGYPVLYTGMGKIEVAIKLTAKILTVRPIFVVNLGSCGSLKHAFGTVLRIKEFTEWDRKLPIEYQKFNVPIFEGATAARMRLDVPYGTCASGDSFVSGDQMAEIKADVFDMEAFAAAKICNYFKIPFISVKCVSDSGEELDWVKNMTVIRDKLAFACEDIHRQFTV